MWWPSYSTADGLSQLNGLCGRQSLYVCVSAVVAAEAVCVGGRLWPMGEESSPLTIVQGGLVGDDRRCTHMAYHKGASGRRNVYMMSSDGPKIETFKKTGR